MIESTLRKLSIVMNKSRLVFYEFEEVLWNTQKKIGNNKGIAIKWRVKKVKNKLYIFHHPRFSACNVLGAEHADGSQYDN